MKHHIISLHRPNIFNKFQHQFLELQILQIYVIYQSYFMLLLLSLSVLMLPTCHYYQNVS